MKPLLNVLYITRPDVYLCYSNGTVEIKIEGKVLTQIPIHNIEQICSFNYAGSSPKLMYECSKRNIPMIFHTPQGKFLAKVYGPTSGNVLVRKQQFLHTENHSICLQFAKLFIIGKIHNQTQLLRSYAKNETSPSTKTSLQNIIKKLESNQLSIINTTDINKLRGLEGISAATYFSSFQSLIHPIDPLLTFKKRTTRPPEDIINTLLSFGYTLLKNDCIAALEANGLDPYGGFLHTAKSGKPALALDLMEEFRPYFVDRFVLKLINKKIIQTTHFLYSKQEIKFTDDGIKFFLNYWQKEKSVDVIHSKEIGKVSRGILPYIQSQQLNKFMRNEIDTYSPFLWG